MQNDHSSLRKDAQDLDMSDESHSHSCIWYFGHGTHCGSTCSKEAEVYSKSTQICGEDMLEKASSDPTFMKHIITGGKSEL